MRKMPKKLQKRLQDYLTKIKKKPPPSFIPISSKKWTRVCKHPKTLSFSINNNNNEITHQDRKDVDDDSAAATLSDIDEFLFENFRSLYIRDDQEEEEEKDVHGSAKALEMKECYDEKEKGDEPLWDKRPLRLKKRRPDYHKDEFTFDLPGLNIDPPAVNLCSSRRFSVSPGRLSSSVRTSTTATTTTSDDAVSNSTRSTRTLNESPTTPNSNNDDDNNNKDTDISLPTDCISMLMYSPNPSLDFRTSMQNMVEARRSNNVEVDWDFMEELLFCYLNLNEKRSHGFILSAFANLVIDMRRDYSDDKAPERSRKL